MNVFRGNFAGLSWTEMKDRRSPLLTIGVTAVVTAAVTAIARNFISGEKKIKRRIAQRYGISDPQFERTMSQLLGPPMFLATSSSHCAMAPRFFPQGGVEGDDFPLCEASAGEINLLDVREDQLATLDFDLLFLSHAQRAR